VLFVFNHLTHFNPKNAIHRRPNLSEIDIEIVIVINIRDMIDFRSKITGNLDETEVEAEVSALNFAITFR